MIIVFQTLIYFRETVLAVLDKYLPPPFKQLFLTLSRNGVVLEDEEAEEQVFADFDEEHGVVFYPPVYAQRYAAVCDCLMDERWSGKLEKVVNMGKHHDINFIRYLTEVPGITQILSVDIECTINCSSDLLDITFDNYKRKRDKPLLITMFQGNAADPDYRLIGCDAVIAIDMIQCMPPHDLDRLVHNVFGFIKPLIVIITTPNADFNVLLKVLDKNGMRKLDHYFEWTRAQLHDWCSNIVARYPGYTVGCRGVGPGPPGTSHCGCSSQLVMFTARDYHKQMELNVNSLALVANLPEPNQISDFTTGWESPVTRPSPINMLCSPAAVESSELQFPGYCYCNSVPSPCSSVPAIPFQDKAAQCNLDIEFGKSFLMFNTEDLYEVLMPRRKSSCRVYEIKNVAYMLNNTMFVVKKFSKTTQNLIAKHRTDALVHTREVMDEIAHLAKMLNFQNKNCLTDGQDGCIWRNINWGENAPYWNQYYKVLAVYNYPYEAKSEDCLILDLISDEINRYVDSQCEDESGHVGKLEIPLSRLMDAVKHITEDVDRVIELMEYNGYEIDGDVVIHSRILVEDGSVTTRDDDWPDNDSCSDWDTEEVNSTSLSDGTNVALDFNARCLRRALDRKMRKLRAMFTKDEEITRELNRVVCRLMKTALTSCKGRQTPVQSKWLQCKLLDLLTLTEKAIFRRKMRFIERYPLNALGYDNHVHAASEMMELCRIKADDTAIRIVEKYRYLVQNSDNNILRDADMNDYYDAIEDDQIHNRSDDYVKELEYTANNDIERHSEIVEKNDIQDLTLNENMECYSLEPKEPPLFTYTDDHSVYKTQQWLNSSQSSYMIERKASMVNSGDDRSSKGKSNRNRSFKKHKTLKNRKFTNSEKESLKRIDDTFGRKMQGGKTKRDFTYKLRRNKQKDVKKPIPVKTSYKALNKILSNKCTGSEFMKRPAVTYETNLVMKPNATVKEQSILQLTAPKPIPDDIIELCHTGLSPGKHFQMSEYSVEGSGTERALANTEESVLIQIITDETRETIALRRTVGTDPDMDPEICEQELLTNVTSIINDDACYGKVTATTENVHSQTIFLYDINEPTTSKGIRHLSTDVQCGTDATVSNYAMLSATTSLTTVPQMFKTCIKIGDSFPDVRMDKTSDFGTSTFVPDRICGVTSPRNRSVGIKIKDSDTQIRVTFVKDETATSDLQSTTKTRNEDYFVMFADEPNVVKSKDLDPPNFEQHNCFPTSEKKVNCAEETNIQSTTTSEILKQVRRHLEDSCSEFNDSVSSASKVRMPTLHLPADGSNSRIALPRFPALKYVRPKLSCGGVHVHSFNNRQISEDVVFQGEWQRCRPKPNRKKPFYPSTYKKNKEAIVKKSTADTKSKTENKIKKDTVTRQAKVVPVQIHKPKLTKTKEETTKQMTLYKKSTNSTKIITRPALKPVKKVASKRSISTNLPKSTSKTKVAPIRKTKSVPPVFKNDTGIPHQIPKNSYIPSYLKKMPKRVNQKQVKNKLNIDIVPNVIKVNKDVKKAMSPQSNAEEIQKELLKVSTEPRSDVNYVVLRNEIENSQPSTVALPETTVTAKPSDLGRVTKRAISPMSQNSSSCSSPNSVATVRHAVWSKPLSSRKHSTPNQKSNSSDSKISSRNRKFTKKIKTSRSGSEKDVSDKENVPASAKNSNLSTNDPEKAVSGGLSIKNNDVFTTQFLSNSVGPLIKSNVKISFPKNIDDRNVPCASKEDQDCSNAENSNIIEIIQPNMIESRTSSCSHSSQSIKIIDNKVLSDWMASSNRNKVESNTNNILSAMKQLVEETLDFIETDSLQHIDSKTIVLSAGGSDNVSLNDTSSSRCFKTINNDSDTFKSAIGTMETNADISVASLLRSKNSVDDIDLYSFKSAPSITKFSDCLADNESCYDINLMTVNSPSVHDIFERKEMILTQHPGALAIQAFSGFSMNAEPVAGDHQADYVNLIDSETGSGAYEIARLATSEELFVSGRSSGSIASCTVEEDSVVPNWLFEIISHQQPVNSTNNTLDLSEGAMDPPELPIRISVDLDENSNEIGQAAGAGDGHGIHSDASQDSSGRGTSFSSSASSSGAQSEAILINPTAFINQFEVLRGPNNGATTAPVLLVPRDSSDASSGIDTESMTRHSNGYRITRPAHELRRTSDVEADVSSTETDIPSDN